MVQLTKSTTKKWKLPIDPRWTGYTSNTHLLNITLFSISLIILFLAPSDTLQLSSSNTSSKIILKTFNIVLPLFAVLHQAVQILAQRYAFANPLASLLLAIFFFLTWTLGLLVWLSTITGGPAQIVRVVLGITGEGGYILALVFSGSAVHRERKRARWARRGLDKEVDFLKEDAGEMGYSV